MFFATAQVDKLTNRLDADFYNPEYLVLDEKIDKFQTISIGSIAGDPKSVTYGVLKPRQYESKFLLARIQNFEDGFLNLDSCIGIEEEQFTQYARSECVSGDLIVALGGYPGKACIISKVESGLRININQHIARVRVSNSSIDAYYLLGYFMSNVGRLSLKRQISGSVQAGINLEDLRNLHIVNLMTGAQKYIGEKVRQAERLRAWAKELQLQIKQQFDFLVKEKPAASKFYRTSIADLEPYRINPGHYDPVVLSLLKRASGEGVNLKPISELLGNRKIAGGATPKGADYLESGVLFGRVQNVKPLALDLSDAVFIDADTNDQLSRSECQVDDIVLSITGYPGTASLVTEQDLPMNINQHSVRFNVNKGVDSAYVCAALNSEFLKLQVQRLSIGGTRDALDFPSVGNLLIPRLSEDIESAVAVSVRNYIKAVQLSKLLTFLAKTLVEELIEGNISEAELVSAQQALEAGDDSLDRALLERMTAEGIDGEGDPLFDDIEQLYDLLEQAKQALDADDTMAEA